MANLNTNRKVGSDNLETSPFYSRTYGGFTRQQIEYICQIVGKLDGKTVLDPMSGQAFELSTWSKKNVNVWLGDIDPTMLILASLRSIKIISNRKRFAEDLKKKLKAVHRKKRKSENLRFVDGWISTSIEQDLHDLSKLLEIGLFSDPFEFSPNFWVDNEQVIFEIGMVLLAAREISCFRNTDNRTWLRPGGRMKTARIFPAVMRALDVWMKHSDLVAGDLDHENYPNLNCRRMDLASGILNGVPKPTTIITSPPYANRLEYTKMWGPETEVMAALCNKSTESIRRNQIGTVLVKDQPIRNLGLEELPKETAEVLEMIREDKAKYSASYYFPFFQMYAQTLAMSIRSLCRLLRKNGTLIVIVRDTVRKDSLFSASQLVRRIATHEFNFSEIKCTQKIVKGHVGQLRKGAVSGVYGLAQQEWWLSFKKDSK